MCAFRQFKVNFYVLNHPFESWIQAEALPTFNSSIYRISTHVLSRTSSQNSIVCMHRGAFEPCLHRINVKQT